MNKQEFLRLIKDPSLVTSSDSDKLEEVIANFPYCQAAHLLIAKIAHQNSSMLAKQKLNKAAAYTLERQKLKRIIYMKTPVASLLPVSLDTEVTPNESNNELTVEKLVPKVDLVTQPALKIKEVELPTQQIPEESHQEAKEETDQTKTLPQDENKDLEVEPLPTNRDIPDPKPTASLADQVIKEKSPVITTEEKSTFFRELEQNLENLRRLKEKNELKAFVGEEVKVPTPRKSLETERFQAYDPAPNTIPAIEVLKTVEHQGETFVPKYTIDSSRLEDVLISPFESQDENVSNGLLFDYLNFLANKKKILFRSREKVNSIIEKFISEEPSIPYSSTEDIHVEVEDLSEESSRVSNHIASENFAKILVRQGKFKKAIAIYNELILKNPEKKAYFAFQIQTLNDKTQ